MKNLLIAALLALSLFSFSYGYELTFSEPSMTSFDHSSEIEFSFWSGDNLFLEATVSPGESCHIRDQYGECSVTCEGKKKAVCQPGYTSGTIGFGNGVKIIPPHCSCQ